MADDIASDLVLALQRNPDVLGRVLVNLADITAARWERLGRSYYRRSIRGRLLGFTRPNWEDPPPNASHQGYVYWTLPTINAGAGQQGTVLEGQRDIDAALVTRGYTLTDVDAGLPLTAEIVSAAAGLTSPTHFAFIETTRAMQHGPVETARQVALEGRHTGRSTTVAVEAITALLNGRNVVVFTQDRKRTDHLCILMTALFDRLELPFTWPTARRADTQRRLAHNDCYLAGSLQIMPVQEIGGVDRGLKRLTPLFDPS